MRSATDTALEFVSRINSHDVTGLAALLTPDHRFIDSLGNLATGRDTLTNGWRQYFAMVPDYRIEVTRVLESGGEVLMVGTARGTCAQGATLSAENAWSTPAALRARVQEGLIAEWQVYADNEPIRRCLARLAAGAT
jgi:ketosteroid isomerase-like protein